MVDGLEEAEHLAVESHKRELCERNDCDVSLKEAYQDWVETDAQDEWRLRRQQIMMALQREEMHRHRWIESEKARRDVGKSVYADWIANHAAEWRAWYQKNELSILRQYNLI